MAAKSQGLLRWRDVIDELQELVALGLFGARMRLRQQPDGTWQLMESIEEQEFFTPIAHTLDGTTLTPLLDLVEGAGVLVDGVLSTNVPAPSIELTESQLTGPTTMAVITSRPDTLTSYTTPAELVLLAGTVGGGDLLNYFQPVGLISGGQVMTLRG